MSVSPIGPTMHRDHHLGSRWPQLEVLQLVSSALVSAHLRTLDLGFMNNFEGLLKDML